MNWGRIYRIRLNFTNPPKEKYVICVHVSEELYLIINSQPRTRAPGAQLLVTSADLAYLKHNSYIDVSNVIRLSSGTYGDQLDNDDNLIGNIAPTLKVKLRLLIEKNRYLTPNQIEKLLNEFDNN